MAKKTKQDGMGGGSDAMVGGANSKEKECRDNGGAGSMGGHGKLDGHTGQECGKECNKGGAMGGKGC